MALQFLTEDDIKGVIGANTLASLRGTADVNLETAESLAITELSPLYTNYNIAAELAKSDTNRNDELVRILTHITAYYLYNTVEDDEIPMRIETNYANQIKSIAKISTGSLSTTLQVLIDDNSYAKSNFRFGGDTERDNDLY